LANAVPVMSTLWATVPAPAQTAMLSVALVSM
jgi:hypothetical protein